MEEHETLDKLKCNGCERVIVSMDGPGMLRALKGPCPDCGGRFVLDGQVDMAVDLDD